jgi:hypothetical protein
VGRRVEPGGDSIGGDRLAAPLHRESGHAARG